MDTLHLPKPGRQHRRYSLEFKTSIVEACRQPGVSVTGIALANQINPNLLRRWLRDFERPAVSDLSPSRHVPAISALVPVEVTHASAAPLDPIQIELRRNGTVLNISWPATQAAACAQWLRELLR